MLRAWLERTPAMLDHALHLASLGFAIVPLHEAFPQADGSVVCSCGRNPCANKPGKHPRTPHGLKDASTASSVIHAWWTQWPTANIAIVTGQASAGVVASTHAAGLLSLFVIDVDGPDGEASLAALGPLPATLEATTGKGRHLYFAGPVGAGGGGLKNSQGKLGLHVDTRGENGYVIAPPSLHASGRRYEWRNWAPIALLPEFVAVRMAGTTAPTNKPVSASVPVPVSTSVVTAPMSPLADIDTAVITKSLDEHLFALVNALPGTKHETLVKASTAHACAAHESQEPREAAEPRLLQLLLGALAQNGQSPVENWGQAEGTVRSAIEKAYARPLAHVLLAYERELSEDGLGRRFAKQYGPQGAGCCCHVPGQGWYLWDGKRWAAQAGNGQPTELVSHMLISIYEDLVRRDQKDVANAVKAKKTAGSMGAILRVAARFCAIPFDAFDANPLLLNCQNGIVDLSSGQLAPHDPRYMCSQVAGCAFDPAARCDGWLHALTQMQGGDGTALEFLRVLLGSFLHGESADQFVIMYGNGFDGKTTILRVLMLALGSYSAAVSPSSVIVPKNGSRPHTSILGGIAGRRVGAIDELPADSQLDTGAIKAAFGRSPIRVQTGMGKDFVDVIPTAKAITATNHMIRIDEHDLGTRRRVIVVPFNADLGAQGVRKDDTFAARLVAHEGAGILAWLVSGFRDWWASGCQLPACDRVVAATAEMFEEGDLLSSFLATCARGSNLSCSASDLYNAYKRFAEETGDYIMSKRAFGCRMRERRMLPHRGTGGVRMYTGLSAPEGLSAGKPPSFGSPPRS